MYNFQVSPRKILTNFKGEIYNLIVEKPDTYHLSHVIKVNFIPCYEALRRAQHHFWGSHTKNAEPQSNHVKTVDKPKVRDIPQNNNLDISSVKVMIGKERWWNCHRWREMKETRLQNAMRILG